MSVSRSQPPGTPIVDLLTIEKIRRGLELRRALRDWALLAVLAYQGLRVNGAQESPVSGAFCIAGAGFEPATSGL